MYGRATLHANRLRDKGCDIELVRDKTGQAKVHSYRFTFGRTTIKASELGVGRNLTASKIENTFRRLHPQATPIGQRAYTSASTALDNRSQMVSSCQSRISAVAQPQVSPKFRKILQVDGMHYNILMPTAAYDAMNNCIEVSENGSVSHDDIMNVAMLLFMNYLDAATSMSESCGGGGSSGSGWGRGKDEDDRDWARRCAMRANWLCKPINRSRRR